MHERKARNFPVGLKNSFPNRKKSLVFNLTKSIQVA